MDSINKTITQQQRINPDIIASMNTTHDDDISEIMIYSKNEQFTGLYIELDTYDNQTIERRHFIHQLARNGYYTCVSTDIDFITNIIRTYCSSIPVRRPVCQVCYKTFISEATLKVHSKKHN